LTKGGAGSKVPGAIYVYLGTANGFASTPSAKISGEANGDHFGEALAAVGDVNGDGYQDVAVGAHDYSCGTGSAGKIYVYLGGPGRAFERSRMDGDRPGYGRHRRSQRNRPDHVRGR
jgi:hypothetical protein